MITSKANSSHGDDAPEMWLDKYGNLLYRFALYRVGDVEVSEDLVQETFVAAITNWEKFEGKSSVKTWLTAILKHKIIDYFRKNSRRNAISPLESDLKNNYTNGSPLDKSTSPSTPWDIDPAKALHQKEFLRILYLCMGKLPQRQSEAFSMREIDGLSTDEICKNLGITASNSWVLIYRARSALRDCLEANWLNEREVKGQKA